MEGELRNGSTPSFRPGRERPITEFTLKSGRRRRRHESEDDQIESRETVFRKTPIITANGHIKENLNNSLLFVVEAIRFDY